MKIGFIGAQSTGKTTILNLLHNALPHYQKCNEATRWVLELGIGINENGNDLTQELILMKHLENLSLYDNMITDRTLIDGYVYTKYLHSLGKVSDSILEKTRSAMYRLIHKYDVIYYLPIEFELENDGVRSVDEEFRLEIDKNFKELVQELNKDYNIQTLTGSPQERLQTIKDKLGDTNAL